MLRTDRGHEAGPPWTASRCNRTLRQLTAFLAKVEKWHRDFSHKSLNQTGGIDEDSNSGSGLRLCFDESKISDPNWLCKQNRQATRGAEKSYAGRRKLRRGLGALPQAKCLPYTPKAPKATEVMIDTPMMTSVLTPPNIHSSEFSYDGQVPEAQLKPPSKSKVALLRRQRDKEAIKGTEALIPANWSCLNIDEMKQIVSSFLVATSEARLMCDGSDDGLYHRKGPKSLVSSCLHRIPSLIIAEQSHHDLTTDGYNGEVQVASLLLTDLEDHYGDPLEGWRPLRVVTRAYGIALICNAIRKRFLPLEAAMSLASGLADWFGVKDATKAIAEAIVEVRQIACVDDLSDILTRSIDGTDSLRKTCSPSTSTKRNPATLRFRLTEMAFKRTSDAVILGLISIRPTYLKDAIKYCSQGHPPDAISLAKTLLLRFLHLEPRSAEAAMARLRLASNDFTGKLENEAIEMDSMVSKDVPDCFAASTSTDANVGVRSFRSGIVALAAFPVSRLMRHRQSDAKHLRISVAQGASLCLLRDICLAIHVDMEIHGVSHLRGGQLRRRTWMVFAYSLLVTMLPVANANHLLTGCLEPLTLSCESRKSLVNDLSSFVLELVTACDLSYERGERGHSLGALKEITATLSCHRFCDSSVVALLFSNIAVEASMRYAQVATKDKPNALLWATELQHHVQASLSGQDITLPTPSLKSLGRGFRWDECISEWIAKTPAAVATDKKRTGSNFFIRDNLALETPLTKRSSLPARRDYSTPDSPVYESMSRRMKKRKSAPEQTGLHWDGDFAFRRPAKKIKSLVGELARPNHLTKPLVDLESEDELGGDC
jgi:hypothetical protein